MLPKVPGSPLPSCALTLIDRYQMTHVPTSDPSLMLYVAQPADLDDDDDARPLRLAVVCDFPEEGWPSMDLFGEMILAHLGREHAGEVGRDPGLPAVPRLA